MAVARSRQIQGRLDAAETDGLIEAYREGLTVRELAVKFGIERRTASAHLRRRGVPMRQRGLSPAQKDQARALREQGWSYGRIGDKFGIDAATARYHILRAQPGQGHPR
ncbi:helix-turn-helix domain-containing protein [Phytoactinopolyspora endophytica]|uniref:helix-turn-helix domain-containing protein n=1 Tax=Phytoactinopolyspora endophytica TaxID=1642495 RepID=UPI00101BE905|nr:helix-turn-helix domain-containing protein [Phytoactinopolyspora endophytica]